MVGGWMVVVRYVNAGVKRAELEIVRIAPRKISTNGYEGWGRGHKGSFSQVALQVNVWKPTITVGSKPVP